MHSVLNSSRMRKPEINPALRDYLKDIESEFGNVPESRKTSLEMLEDYILFCVQSNRIADLVFICTHNSRRSQFSQAWTTTAAEYYGIEGIRSYSGGTESSEVNPRAVAALRRAGYSIQKVPFREGNPGFLIRSEQRDPGNTLFSKKYDDPRNPQSDFCAVLVCSDADEACPFIPGAEKRVSLPYDDPKAFDGTAEESQMYDKRCREIARDLFFVFHNAARDLSRNSP